MALILTAIIFGSWKIFDANRILGDWVLINSEGKPLSSFWKFNKDTSVVLVDGGSTSRARWSRDGDILTIYELEGPRNDENTRSSRYFIEWGDGELLLHGTSGTISLKRTGSIKKEVQHEYSKYSSVKIGYSRGQVDDILGPPEIAEIISINPTVELLTYEFRTGRFDVEMTNDQVSDTKFLGLNINYLD